MDVRKRKHSKEKLPIKVSSSKSSNEETTSAPKQTSSYFGCIKYIILVIILPAILNHAALFQEERQLKPPGELYDIGWGEKLFMNCSGEGQPTVLLDAPTGKSSDAWVKVQPLVAKFTKVCVYDRAGLGFSQRPMENWSQGNQESLKNERKRGQPFTTERMVDDFHQLFTTSSSSKKPFILVGAGLGAVNMRFYTHIYDEDVAGVVLINPLVESLFSLENEEWTNHWYGNVVSSFQLLQLFAAIGLNRVALIMGLMKSPLVTEDVTEVQAARQKYLLCRPAHISSSVDEHYFANISLAQLRTMRTIKSFPRVPVSIITSVQYDTRIPKQINELWAEQQKHLASSLSASSLHKQVSCSEDQLLPEHYKDIVHSIKHLVKTWREEQTHSNI